ncbi:hypothetical protein HDU97_008997 [Phlyctochytrium planicorne]|nr:hypothetical protein HDU97_008997 [Phlyctochytrium planicorne]
MLSFTTILASFALIGSAVTANHVPGPPQAYIPKDLEQQLSMVHCLVRDHNDASNILYQYSDIALFTNLDETKNATHRFPSDYLGANQVATTNIFEDPKQSFKLVSGREVVTDIKAGSTGAAPNTAVGSVRVLEKISETTTIGYFFDCVKGDQSTVFNAKVNTNNVDCFSDFFCKFGNRATA